MTRSSQGGSRVGKPAQLQTLECPAEGPHSVRTPGGEQTETLVRLNQWEPEEVVNHLVYSDVEQGLDFGVMPGTALCGHVFTLYDDLGPAAGLAGDPRFVVVEECQRCISAWAAHLARGWRPRS